MDAHVMLAMPGRDEPIPIGRGQVKTLSELGDIMGDLVSPNVEAVLQRRRDLEIESVAVVVRFRTRDDR